MEKLHVFMVIQDYLIVTFLFMIGGSHKDHYRFLLNNFYFNLPEFISIFLESNLIS